MAKPQPRVLLVDDEDEYVSVLSERLILRGLNVYTASRGDEAISLIEEYDIDVALIDLIMPGISGLELLKHIKTIRPNIQVILLTGRGSTREGLEGMRSGAFDYINKLEDIESLIARIEAAMHEASNR